MAHNRPVDPGSRGEGDLLYDLGPWVIIAIVLFLLWANTPLARLGPQQGEKAKISVTQTQIEQFKTAAQLFTIDNGHAPKSLDELIHQPGGTKHWKKYLEDLNEIPKDPWGQDYLYQSPGPRGGPYLITSDGPDGQPNTRDDITSNTP